MNSQENKGKSKRKEKRIDKRRQRRKTGSRKAISRARAIASKKSVHRKSLSEQAHEVEEWRATARQWLSQI